MHAIIGEGATLAFILTVIVAMLALLTADYRKSRTPRVVARQLMTPAEIAFWRLLRQAAAPLHVAPQVAMGALVTTERRLSSTERRTARSHFDRESVDFVLIDDSAEVRLIIEFSDRAADAERVSARSRVIAEARYRTLRVRRSQAADLGGVRAAIGTMLAAPGAR